MRNKTLTNKKVISALMIGISAMMTLQSPVTAYASGNVEDLPDNTGPEPDTTTQAESVDTYEPVTEQASAQAETAQEAISNPVTQEQADSGAASGAAQEAQEAASLILEGNEQVAASSATEEGTKAGEAIETLIEAAEAIVQDGPQEDGSIAPSALSDFGTASSKIEEVKGDLAQAETENRAVESAYAQVQEESKEIVDSANMMISTADSMDETVVSTDEKASALVESIQEAESPQEAQKAYDDLEKLVSDMKDDLAAKKALYDKMVSDYENAVQKLELAQEALDQAQDRFEGKVSDAVQGTIVAEASVAEAQRKVDNLAEALDKVEEKLEIEDSANELAMLRGSREWSGSIGGIEKNRKIMREVVVNYYMPQVLGIDILIDEVDYARDFEAVSGAEGQEYNYHKFTYKYRDEDGNIQTGVKYFNWDSLTKINLSKLNLNSGEGVVIFEKTEDEIAADTKVKEYYKGQSILNNNNKKTAYNQGKFDVFMYTDDTGQKNYLIRDEIKNTEGDEKFVFDQDGTPLSYDGKELTMVVQNQNNLHHEGNCIIVASEKNIVKYTTHDTEVRNYVIRSNGQERLSEAKVNKIIEDSRALNTFIAQNSVATNPNTGALMSKYAQYKEATIEAKEAAAKATEEVGKLSDAIDAIKEKSKNKKSKLAVDVLGTTDVAARLGLTVTDQEAEKLNAMTMSELITELNNRKEKADKKAADAQAKATELENKFNSAAGVLESTIARLNPPSGGGTVTLNVEAVGDLAGGEDITASAVTASAGVRPGVALENNASAGTSGVALENDASSGTNGVALENNASGTGGAGADVVNIQDESVALSDGFVTEDGSEVDSRPTVIGQQSIVKASEEAIVTIEDEDAALAAFAETGTVPEKKNWFWLIVIAIFGTAGEVWYKNHLKKKEEELKNEDDEWE